MLCIISSETLHQNQRPGIVSGLQQRLKERCKAEKTKAASASRWSQEIIGGENWWLQVLGEMCLLPFLIYLSMNHRVLEHRVF